MNQLFRPEAVQHAARRLSGDVILATPLSIKTLGLLCAAIVVAAAGLAATSSYARKASVTGWLVPDQGVIRVPTYATGLLQTLHVKEGDVVEKGTRVAEISVSTEMASGNLGDVIARGLTAETEAARTRAAAALERLEAEDKQLLARIKALGKELGQAQQQAKLQEQNIAPKPMEVNRYTG